MDKNSNMENNMIMIFFYMGKLVEGGFAEHNDSIKLTEKGFDRAMDLKESGWIVPDEDVLLCCKSMNIMEFPEAFAALIIEVQRIGLPAMIEKAKTIE